MPCYFSRIALFAHAKAIPTSAVPPRSRSHSAVCRKVTTAMRTAYLTQSSCGSRRCCVSRFQISTQRERPRTERLGGRRRPRSIPATNLGPAECRECAAGVVRLASSLVATVRKTTSITRNACKCTKSVERVVGVHLGVHLHRHAVIRRVCMGARSQHKPCTCMHVFRK